jgi:hypothetical protein
LWRCGRTNHYTIECNAKSREKRDSREIATIRSQHKRTRNNDDKGIEHPKKATIVAVRAVQEE